MVGVFIGSFNPPTKAHLDICLKLEKDFSKIVLVPVNSNNKNLININDRINMLNILKRKYSFLEISDIMKKYSYVNYRIIDLLNKEYNSINIIMGSDLLEKFDTFDNYDYLLNSYNYTIIPRENIDVNKIINDKYKKYKDKFRVIDYKSNVSSTIVKEYLKENKDLTNMIDKDIYCYIKENNLY